MLDDLPVEIVEVICQFLNPAERFRTSCVSRRYRRILPVWLRIKIHSPSSQSSLRNHFYVSSAEDMEHPLLRDPEDINSHKLRYNVDYVLWTFDYERSNQVFLGRHGQKLLYQEDPQFLFTLGLRPKEPNQTWRILPRMDTLSQQSVQNQELVSYGDAVCLTVGGSNESCSHRPDSPDSARRLYLSAHTLSMGALWYAIHDREWCIDEQLQVFPSSDYTPNNVRSKNNNCSNSALDVSDRTKVRLWSSRISDISEREVIVHAVPSILDGGYSLYAPESLLDGRAECALHHASISCRYWIEKGTLIFHAFESLPFMFGVPVLEEDAVDHSKGQTEPLAVFLKKNSSRWWAIKHYFSTAADADDGRDFQMDTFIQNSKDHEDHTVIYEKDTKMVRIVVKDAVVDKYVPDVSWKESAVWKFMMCG